MTIWRDVYAADYPEDATPFSFVTRAELQRLATGMRVTAGTRFADIACGQGGPSLLVARQSGAAVIGVDFSRVAVALAKTMAGARGLAHKAAFVVADAAATGLGAASIDAVMSVDAMQLMPHREAVLSEVSRILKPGGRFAFTTWLSRHATNDAPFPVDYQTLLEAAELILESCDEPPDWERRESAVFACIRDSAPRLRAELGETVTNALTTEAARMSDVYPRIRRVNIVARKPR